MMLPNVVNALQDQLASPVQSRKLITYPFGTEDKKALTMQNHS